MKAIYTVGVSASGKTQWAEQQSNFEIICRDDIRYEILLEKGFQIRDNMWRHWNFKWESEVTERVDVLIELCTKLGKDIIFADTNLNQDRLRGHRNKMEQLGYETEVKYFPVKYDEAITRDRKRVDTVGESTIRKQWLQWIKLPSNITGIRKYKRDDFNPYCVLVDVDGTVAKMVDRGPFDWDRVLEDECNWHVCNIVEMLAKHPLHNPKIIFLSGRDGICYDDTKEWLTRYFPNMEFELIMRAAGDMRKDAIIKAELFFKHIEPNYNVMCVIDDRPQVIRMWTDIGLDVINVGNYYEEF